MAKSIGEIGGDDAKRNRHPEIGAALGSALQEVLAIVELETPAGADSDQVMSVLRMKLAAAKELVPLLERAAKMYGLDAAEKKPADANGNGTLAELERKLALVGPGKAS